ncbi:MAG: Na+/H+ antiporter NhaC family protein [Candidatus Aminicenantaceae bacterium]
MQNNSPSHTIRYLGGTFGAVLPFVVFIVGVVIIALSGAPDERGFWPVLLLALFLGLVLARNRREYCETVIEGMAQPIVMIMLTAWMLASIIGVLLSETGFIEALTWMAASLKLGGPAFVLAAFVICCLVSVSTGTSFGTILICGPILYPAGGLVGAPPVILAGAILGGATFGDCIAPISDTTIASALSQDADIGGTVRSRLKYVLPAAVLALIAYGTASFVSQGEARSEMMLGEAGARSLPMILVPLLIIILLLRGRHLLEGLLVGLAVGIVLGLALGRLDPGRILTLDSATFSARSFIIDGIERAVGISFFTILLMGLVATLQASGVLQRLVDFAHQRSRSARSGETWIVGAASGAVLLTCHSIVAILTVSEFARQIGEKKGIHRYRRANLLSLTVSTYPFILPYFIPVILMANTTASGVDHGLPRLSPLQAGLHNYFSWAVMLILILALAFGYGRPKDALRQQKHIDNK